VGARLGQKAAEKGARRVCGSDAILGRGAQSADNPWRADPCGGNRLSMEEATCRRSPCHRRLRRYLRLGRLAAKTVRRTSRRFATRGRDTARSIACRLSLASLPLATRTTTLAGSDAHLLASRGLALGAVPRDGRGQLQRADQMRPLQRLNGREQGGQTHQATGAHGGWTHGKMPRGQTNLQTYVDRIDAIRTARSAIFDNRHNRSQSRKCLPTASLGQRWAGRQCWWDVCRSRHQTHTAAGIRRRNGPVREENGQETRLTRPSRERLCREFTTSK